MSATPENPHDASAAERDPASGPETTAEATAETTAETTGAHAAAAQAGVEADAAAGEAPRHRGGDDPTGGFAPADDVFAALESVPGVHASEHEPAPAEHEPAHTTAYDDAPAKRTPWATRAAAVLAAALVLAGSTTLAYQAGQTGYTTPPGTVTMVEPADDAVGFAARVYAVASPAVVRLSQTGGVGSGFFYAPGKIVTNAHVVTAGDQTLEDLSLGRPVYVDVLLHDGRTRRAEVTAIDARLDVAVLTTDPVDDIPILPFAESLPASGSPVAAIGHPFGESQVVTTGIVSGVSVNSRFAESDVQSLLLQIDAAINPGNSGGPVLDASGAVVGVATLRPDTADGRNVSGLSLAIPGPVLAAAVTQLEEDGTVEYPMLGVTLRPSTAEDTVEDAAVIMSVSPESGADGAGIKKGDSVVAIEGTEVSSMPEVVVALLGHEPGESVTVEMVTGSGREKTVQVILGSR